MASVIFPAYSQNYLGWNTYDITVQTTDQQWAVTCFVPDGRMATIDGEQKPSGVVYVIGTEAAVPETPTVAYSYTGMAGTGDPNFCMQFAPTPTRRNGYIYFESGSGTTMSGTENANYEFETFNDFISAIDNGDIRPILPKVYFDIYINGIDKPSIFVNWTAPEDLSPAGLAPNVWIGCQSIISIVPDITEDAQGLKVPNMGAWNVDTAGNQSYAGSYSTTYLSIQQNFEKYLNAISKFEQWGIDGQPAYIRLYLRMDYSSAEGTDRFDLFRVQINLDGTYGYDLIPGSDTDPNIETVLRFHTGEPDYIPPEDPDSYPSGTNIDGDEPGKYDPDDLPPDFSDSEGNGFDGNAILTKTYAVSAATLQNIGQKLWSQSYFNVLKIQSNPIENIVAVKAFPFAMTGSAEEVKVGDVAFGVNGDKVPSVKKIVIGTCKYVGKFGNYLDLAPFVTIKINLPYIGLIQLDPADIFNATLKCEYLVDLVTGQCMAMLSIDGIPYMNVFGQMGIDIPLTSSDRVQTELRAASAALTAIGGAAPLAMAGDLGGAAMSGGTSLLNIVGADYTSQRTSSQSPACGSFQNHKVFLQIERLLENPESAGYKHLHGYPCHKYMKLSSFPRGSFIQVDRRSDMKIAMTSEENRIIESLLTQGVYI